jgi:hypothetical protein
MLPNYLIIGAARSGTSWLAKNLMLHPEVFMPTKKEIHFFDRHYEKGLEWYQRIFEGRSEKAIGEATPAYLYFPHIPSLIHEYMPNVRLIVSLRNPVERAYSHYWNLIARAGISQRYCGISFEEMIMVPPRLVEEGMYATKLKGYYQLFPRENVLILIYDDLKENPEKFLKSLYSFLGVDAGFISPLAEYKINAKSSKLGRSTALYFLYRASIKLGFYRLANLIDIINKKGLPDINIETKRELLEKYYLREISELEQMINRSLSAWKRV